MFTLLNAPWDPYKLCKKKKKSFLLKIFYFSICLTSNKLYWIEDKLADVSTRFTCRQVGVGKLNGWQLDWIPVYQSIDITSFDHQTIFVEKLL